jgi:hypothetical protein
MAESYAGYPAMSKLTDWLGAVLKLKTGSPETSATRQLAEETYARVADVRELRQNVLENRDFPIVGLLRNEPLKEREREGR